MIKETITIINKLGLHARAAAKFVATTSRFTSDIQVFKKSQQVNGKSIMGVMMLAASQGTELDFEINGEDESEARDAIFELINNRFDEPE